MIQRVFVAGLCCMLLGVAGASAQDSGPIEDPAPPLPPAPYIVLFDPGNAALTETAKVVLDQVMLDYKANKPPIVYVNGYYDRSGTESYAEQMSRATAEAVRDYLVASGMPADVIRVAWFGENHPLVESADGVAEAANRSVDILFTTTPNPRRS